MTPNTANSNIHDNGIRIEGLRKVYGQGEAAVEALKDVHMAVAPGEVVGLVRDRFAAAMGRASSALRARARAHCSNAWAPSSSPPRAA